MSDFNLEKKLIQAYNQMLDRIHEYLNAEEAHTAPTLEQRLQLAKERAIALQELSAEEAEKVAQFLKRDLHAAAAQMQHSGEQVSQWLDFDLQLIESQLFDLFSSVADKTRLELAQLAQQAELAQQYHTGDITSIGRLVCDQCGTELLFRQTGHIPPCGNCHHTVFHKKTTTS